MELNPGDSVQKQRFVKVIYFYENGHRGTDGPICSKGVPKLLFNVQPKRKFHLHQASK